MSRARLVALGVAAVLLAILGTGVAMTKGDTDRCDRLRRQLSTIEERLPYVGLEDVTPEEEEAFLAAFLERSRLSEELDSHDCT